jgi:hypothetical protein
MKIMYTQYSCEDGSHLLRCEIMIGVSSDVLFLGLHRWAVKCACIRRAISTTSPPESLGKRNKKGNSILKFDGKSTNLHNPG